MAQRIFLHLGSHKTGTTAVQSWLHDNEGALTKIGVHLPKAGRNTSQANFRSLAMALAMPRGEGHPGFADLRRAFRREVRANPEEDFLISAEYFSLILTQPGFKTAIKRLRRFGLEPQAGLVLRNPIDLINSAYAQRCKTLRLGEDFDEYLEEFFYLKRGHWPLRVRRLTELGLNPQIGVYDPEKTDSPRQVMSLFGLDEKLPKSAFKSAKRKNNSIGELGVLCTYHLKRAMAGLETAPTRGAKDWMSDRLVETVASEETRAFNGLSDSQVANIQRKSQPQLETLAKEHLGGNAEALLTSDTAHLGQSPLRVEEIRGETSDKVRTILRKTLEIARVRPEFSTHFPIDPFPV